VEVLSAVQKRGKKLRKGWGSSEESVESNQRKGRQKKISEGGKGPIRPASSRAGSKREGRRGGFQSHNYEERDDKRKRKK